MSGFITFGLIYYTLGVSGGLYAITATDDVDFEVMFFVLSVGWVMGPFLGLHTLFGEIYKPDGSPRILIRRRR